MHCTLTSYAPTRSRLVDKAQFILTGSIIFPELLPISSRGASYGNLPKTFITTASLQSNKKSNMALEINSHSLLDYRRRSFTPHEWMPWVCYRRKRHKTVQVGLRLTGKGKFARGKTLTKPTKLCTAHRRTCVGRRRELHGTEMSVNLTQPRGGTVVQH